MFFAALFVGIPICIWGLQTMVHPHLIKDHIKYVDGTLVEPQKEPIYWNWFMQGKGLFHIRYKDRNGIPHGVYARVGVPAGVYFTGKAVPEPADK